MRRVQKLRPNDFWVNFELANLLTPVAGGEPARAAEAVGFLRAALALRPNGVSLSVRLVRAEAS